MLNTNPVNKALRDLERKRRDKTNAETAAEADSSDNAESTKTEQWAKKTSQELRAELARRYGVYAR